MRYLVIALMMLGSAAALGAQDTQLKENTLNTAILGMVGAILPYAQGRAVMYLLDWIKKTYAWVDSQTGWVKEVMVVLLNAVPVFLSSYLGIPDLVGLQQWDYTIAGTVLSSAISFSVKAGVKSKALETRINSMITPPAP